MCLVHTWDHTFFEYKFHINMYLPHRMLSHFKQHHIIFNHILWLHRCTANVQRLQRWHTIIYDDKDFHLRVISCQTIGFPPRHALKNISIVPSRITENKSVYPCANINKINEREISVVIAVWKHCLGPRTHSIIGWTLETCTDGQSTVNGCTIQSNNDLTCYYINVNMLITLK